MTRINRFTTQAFRLRLFVAIAIASSSTTMAQSTNSATIPAPSESRNLSAQSALVFRTITPVRIGSSIVRLGDVIRPVNENLAIWPQLKRAWIGLVPVSGKEMVIDRERLGVAIRNTGTVFSPINLLGPDEIKVIYDATLALPDNRSRAEHQPNPNLVQPINHSSPSVSRSPGSSQIRHAFGSTSTQHGLAHNRASLGQSPEYASQRLSEPAAVAVINRILAGIRRNYPELSDSYDIEIDTKSPHLTPLKMMVGLPEIEFESTPGEGLVNLKVTGKSADGDLVATVATTFQSLPKIYFPAEGLKRGQLITINDVVAKPMAKQKVKPSHIQDIDFVVGRQARQPISANVPLSTENIGPPIIVNRGDRVDLQIVRGGIRVTTPAKAMGSGAESDTIEIETLSPRKRMLARVVDATLVEIITRAQTVR